MKSEDRPVTCNSNCPAFSKHKTLPLTLCKLVKDSNIPEPYCWSAAYQGNSCRHNRTEYPTEIDRNF